MQSAANRQPVGWTVDHVETAPLDAEQREHAVNSLATLINTWNELQGAT